MSNYIRKPIKWNVKNQLEFQLTEIFSGDEKSGVTNSGYDTDYGENDTVYKSQNTEGTPYIIYLFGVTAKGESISLRITGYRPYFYVELPQPLFKDTPKEICTILLKSISKSLQTSVKFELIEKEVLFGYTNRSKFKVIRVEVPNMSAFWNMRKKLMNQKCEPLPIPLKGYAKPQQLTVYETNIDPVLRFIHARDLKTSGWIKVPAGKYGISDKETISQIAFECEWTDVYPLERIEMAPMVIASWDIECTSSHGDFPVGKKRFERVAADILDVLQLHHKTGKIAPTIYELVEEALWKTTVVRPQGYQPAVMSRIFLKQDIKPDTILPASEIKDNIRTYRDYVKSKLHDPTRLHLYDEKYKREDKIQALTALLNSLSLLEIKGDEVIQIGTSLKRLGNSESEKHIFTLRSCAPINGVIVHAFEKEDELIIAWAKFIQETNPDVMVGYNICSFDERYIYERASETGCLNEFQYLLGRFPELKSELQRKELSSSAMGQNIMYMIDIPGRIRIDLFHYIKRNYQLESYKLDSVSAVFMASDVIAMSLSGRTMLLKCKSTEGLRCGQFITLQDANGEPIERKFVVTQLKDKEIICTMDCSAEIFEGTPTRWAQAKDDIHPKDIFRCFSGTAEDRANVAKYCVQDCDLVLDLEEKLRTLLNAMAMANVCSVPTSYIFNRGQGIKIESLIFKYSAKRNSIIRVLPSPNQNDPKVLQEKEERMIAEDDDEEDDEDEEGYEGAVVLQPNTGFYGDDPVAVLDYASLYPSTIISENISHDSLVWVRDYDNDGKWLNKDSPTATSIYDNLDGVRYIDIDFDILKPDPEDLFTKTGKVKKHPRTIKFGKRICRYAQYPDGEKATMPVIVETLLKTRKETRKLQENHEKYSFTWQLLEMMQLAYKITANSLYGQLGSATSKIRCIPLAASITAYGRKQIMFSRTVIEKLWGPGNPLCSAKCVYGDTDSLFIAFYPKDADNKKLTGWPAVLRSQELAEQAGHAISAVLKAPQDFEFDKIFWPFVLLSKKRYVGHMYEEPEKGENSYVVKPMGIALKRRDNAPIVKIIFKGAVDAILKHKSIPSAAEYIKQQLMDLATGKVPMRKLTISKSLRAGYANPERIAHKVLADRITARDPGNAPQSGDRISFAYILPPPGTKEPKSQGERIETPEFILEHKLRLDYMHYITNQILKPVGQFMAVMLEDIPGFYKLGRSVDYYRLIGEREADRQLKRGAQVIDEVKVHKKIEQTRIDDVETLLFADAERIAVNKAAGQQTILNMFNSAKEVSATLVKDTEKSVKDTKKIKVKVRKTLKK